MGIKDDTNPPDIEMLAFANALIRYAEEPAQTGSNDHHTQEVSLHGFLPAANSINAQSQDPPRSGLRAMRLSLATARVSG
jgi:hypothetical protein